MKNKNHSQLSLLFMFLFCTAVCATPVTVRAQQVLYNINGNAAGSQAIPSVNSNADGTITGTYNPATKVLDFYSTWNNLSGAPTTAGFFSGAPGVNGKPMGDPWKLGTNNRPTGHTIGKILLTEAQEKDLIAGNWYYSYGTLNNNTGEIRGQISVIPR